MNLFTRFEYVSSMPYFNHIVIICLFTFILTIIGSVIISYIIIKLFKFSINDYNILFYQYGEQSQKLLNLYGDYTITRMYIIKQPVKKLLTFVINLFTFYNFDKVLRENPDIFPYHISTIFEIKLPNKMKKLILLEKTNSVNICENFPINNSQVIKTINIKNKNLTINSILNETQKRIGQKIFFNWHIYNNNCQSFTKEILITVNKYSKFKKFIITANKKFFNTIIPTEFTLHMYNSIIIFTNIVEKYIYNFNIY